MAGYVQVGDVSTWYDGHGSGEPLVLLHPGGVDARALAPNLEPLGARFHVFTPERRGHGHTPDVEGPISYELMAQDTIAYLKAVVGEPAHLVGASDGATVALLAALRRPGEVSPDGPSTFPPWPGRMHAEEPTLAASALRGVRSRTLVMVGDDDEVTLEHAIELYRGLGDGGLAVVPGASHGLLVEQADLCNTLIVDFLANDPVPTLAPIRRATGG